MAITLLVALNCLAARAVLGRGPITPLLLGGLPMADALAVGLVVLWRGPRHAGLRRFLAGFETSGWLALLSFGLCCLIAERQLDAYVSGMFSVAREFIPANPFRRGPVSIPVASFAMLLAFLILPQLVPALIAGWLACCLRLRGTSRPMPSNAAESNTSVL
jgi:hypothetical protein